MMGKKPSTTPKSSVSDPFPDLPYEGPEPDKAAAKAPAEDPRIDAMMKAITGLTETVAGLAGREPPVVYVQPAQAPTQPTGPAELADPLEDPTGFANGLLSRVDEIVAGRLNDQNSATAEALDQNAAFDGLWAEFSEYDPYWSDPERADQIEFATTKVMKRAAAKGVDMSRYMFQNSEKFFAAVVAEAEKTFGTEEDSDGEQGDDTQVAPSSRGEPDRSGGIFPAHGAVMPSAKGKANGQGSDFLGEIQNVQKKSGFW